MLIFRHDLHNWLCPIPGPIWSCSLSFQMKRPNSLKNEPASDAVVSSRIQLLLHKSTSTVVAYWLQEQVAGSSTAYVPFTRTFMLSRTKVRVVLRTQ